MAIYKLGEIGTFKGGISTLKKDKYDKGIYFINYMDIFNNVFIDNTKIKTMRLYDATEADINKYRVNFGDILFTASSEKREEIGMTSVFLNNESNIFNGFSKVFKFNDKSHFNPKYLAYYFRTKFVRDQIVSFATGYTRYNISQKDLEKIILVLPSLEEQEKIIDIIEPFENLFLKYSNCVRIDSFNNCKNDVKKIIDIIEPIEKNIHILKNIILKIEDFFKLRNFDKKIKIKDISREIKNGFAYSPSTKNDNGELKIYTIKNISNKNNYDKTNVIKNNILNHGDVITGLSGTLGTGEIISESGWVANQRTLTMSSDYGLNILISILLNKDNLNRIATGAVQKNLTANNIIELNAMEVFDGDKDISLFYLNINKQLNKMEEIRKNIISLLIK
ncbi:hypothetical protein CG006_01660 [Mesoplasma florum]|uniref:restriction endonuclease subunit S n=1 Tax=Mesoplasma florum TaxID=2151 RepID=UPI000D02BD0E|nr:restriction endonuclease subunit S [Mesoplasma florum]AVN63684.1 hypothetical protein CG006_01660 [Mesoplasma florum]